MQEFVNQLYIRIFFLHFLVEIFNLDVFVVGHTRNISVYFCCHSIPLGFVDTLGIRVVNFQGQCFHLVECLLPSRVYAFVKEKFNLFVGTSKRVVGNLVAAGSEVLLADSLYLLHRHM